MSKRDARRVVAELLTATAADYQTTAVIPHCARCLKPCCRLDTLVLELNWEQLKTFWQITQSRTDFDRQLSSGNGPEEIRTADGLYFAHRKACPAYDETGHACRVYDRDLKPTGCSDFPVYRERGNVVVDLRCEAVNLELLTTRIAVAVGQEFRVVACPDNDFPFLVSLSLRRVAGTTSDDSGH